MQAVVTRHVQYKEPSVLKLPSFTVGLPTPRTYAGMRSDRVSSPSVSAGIRNKWAATQYKTALLYSRAVMKKGII